MANKKTLNIIYTNIGRGHPFYLDGICDEISRNYSNKISLNIKDVFELSSGLSLLLWKLIRVMYKCGSQGGFIGKIYSAIRQNKKTDSYGLVERILATGIRDFIKKNRYPTLVAHPMLVSMISDLTDVYYQHGELALPETVIVKGAGSVFVPTDAAKKRFVQQGINEEKLTVTGLCIENELRKNATELFENRLLRLNGDDNLVGVFYSSGAEPTGHVEKIIKMLLSLKKNRQKAIVFCKAGGKLEKEVNSQLNAENIIRLDEKENIDSLFDINNILTVSFADREDENRFTAVLFKYFDYFVSPSHERTNWALGLGIPMFLLHPLIGPFSPINRNILLANNIAKEIIDNKMAEEFYELISRLKSNKDLILMAKNCYGKFRLDGFREICTTLESRLMNV